MKYPTDSGLAAHGVRALAREGQKLAKLVGEQQAAGAGSLAGDGSHAAGDHAHDPSPHRGGEVRGAEADRADRRAAGAVDRGDAAAGAVARAAGARPRREGEAEGGRPARAARRPLREGRRQIKQRVAGEPIKDRLVSLSDPDARPIRKGKLGKPNEFGYVTQLAEVTENTRRGARGLILPAATHAREPGRGHAAARRPSRN